MAVDKDEAPRSLGADGAALPTFRQAARVWLRIGCLSFGGPAGQIALLHREVVEERRWINDRRFLQALNFCTLLPGPEAQQLATYLGWMMHGAAGGLTAGLLFVIPGAVVMLGLSVVYATWGAVPAIAALFFGLKSAVLVIVIEAVSRIGRRALNGVWASGLAALAFVALFILAVPFPLVMLACGLAGALAPARFVGSPHTNADDGAPSLIDVALAADPGRHARHARGARRAGLMCLLAWLAPVVALRAAGGRYAEIAWFFSKMAVVTFGGAYAVLAYVAQEAVGTYHWLAAPEMLAGLGLAETTPGPLILVLQFVGFLAGFRAPGPLTGLPGGAAASLLTLWVAFAPSFAFVFLGAPLIERLRENRTLSGALAAITACVVGVLANLAVWFGLHVLFAASFRLRAGPIVLEVPLPASIDLLSLLMAFVSAIALFRLKLGVLGTLALSAAVSLMLHVVPGGA